MTIEQKKQALQQLYNNARACLNCPYEKKEHNHRVFGTGNLNATLMFVGEAPGEQEDLEKRPFVGRAGKLLNHCFEKAGFSRNDIFITNIVKCRPPNNRTPLPEEITPELKALLDQEIAIIQPKVICTLGLTAARALLEQPVSMGAVRNKQELYQGRILTHAYHPAYILRNRNAEPEFIKDLEKIYLLSLQKH